MADSLCRGLSEKSSSERVFWRKAAGTAKSVPETEMAETLGCIDGQCGKEERREHSGELQHLSDSSRSFRAVGTDSPVL